MQEWLTRNWLRLKALLQRRQLDRDLEDELEFHFSKRGATAEARKRFGNRTRWKEQMREQWTFAFLEDLAQDLRYAGRMLRKSPWFAAVAIFSLALGIGGVTAIFSLMNPLLIRRLPVHKPEQLVAFGKNDHDWFSYQAYEVFRGGATQWFSGIFATCDTVVSVNIEGNRQEAAQVDLITGSYFPILGVTAILGRTLTPDDDRVIGGHPVVVLSAAYWDQRFNRDPQITGKVIRINRFPFTVIGVAASGFSGLNFDAATHMWVPATMQREVKPGDDWFAVRSGSEQGKLNVFGRLKPGVRLEDAQPPMREMWMRQQTEVHGSSVANRRLRERPLVLESGSRGVSSIRRIYTLPLQVLTVVTGLVLLIACTNLANLLLARAGPRRREFGLRLSLGAGRGRLIRQMLTEAALISVCGALIGLLLAAWGIRILLYMASTGSHPLPLAATLDWRAISFATLVTVATTLLFGLWPALRATQIDISSAMKAGNAGTGRDGSRSSGIVLLVEVSLSVLLLFGAGLFLQTLRNLRHKDLGIQPERLIQFDVGGLESGSRGESYRQLCRDLPARIATLPGVRGVTLSINGLFSGWSRSAGFRVPGFLHKDSEGGAPNYDVVGAGYFSTLGIPMLAGRDFGARDSQGAAKVIIVNEAIARFYFPDGDPIGRKVSINGSDREIVGVVRDVRDYKVRQAPKRFFYIPILQAHETELVFVTTIPFLIRTTAEPQSVMSLIRQAVRAENPSLSVERLNSVPVLIERQLSVERTIAELSTYFAFLAVLLVAIGVHGVLSHRIVQRTKEIGIRIALGALPGRVVWTVTREGLGFLIAGILVGLGAASSLSRFVTSLLFEVKPIDPLLMGATIGALVLAVLPAALAPALRAARVDPSRTLRQE